MFASQEPEVQTASLAFFGPVAAAYAFALATWWLVTTTWPRLWSAPAADPPSERPWVDFGVCVAVVVAVLGVGQLYQHGLLLPGSGGLVYTANQLLIYAPLFVALALRRQGGRTVWVTAERLPVKLAFGAALGVGACAVFLATRGELHALPRSLMRAFTPYSLAHFFPVFMEGVALAFLFVRLQWVFGRWLALLLPALLFAAAHVPRALADGADGARIAAFFVFNTVIVVAILAVIRRSRDVIWLGIVHYLMDVPSGAF
jgi:membrane protease YdiL (CAAX protease family)